MAGHVCWPAVISTPIIFPAEYNPKGPGMNAIIKRHEHVLQNNTVFKKLFPTDLFIFANKSAKSLLKLYMCRSLKHKNGSFRSNWPWVIIGSWKNFVCMFCYRTKFKIGRGSTCNMKNVRYLAYCKKCNKQSVGSIYIQWMEQKKYGCISFWQSKKRLQLGIWVGAASLPGGPGQCPGGGMDISAIILL